MPMSVRSIMLVRNRSWLCLRQYSDAIARLRGEHSRAIRPVIRRSDILAIDRYDCNDGGDHEPGDIHPPRVRY
jgi:hypothetical protein